jgi:hypothetical protein
VVPFAGIRQRRATRSKGDVRIAPGLASLTCGDCSASYDMPVAFAKPSLGHWNWAEW